MWISFLAQTRWVTFTLGGFLIVAGIVLIVLDPGARAGWVTAGIGVGAIMIQRYVNAEAKKLHKTSGTGTGTSTGTGTGTGTD